MFFSPLICSISVGVLGYGRAADAFNLLSEGLEYPHPIKVREEYLPLMRELKPLADIQNNYNSFPVTGSDEVNE